MAEKSSPIPEERIIRCKKLGHEVAFKYCSIEKEGLPCLSILNCWGNINGLSEWLAMKVGKSLYPQYISFTPPPKMLSLIELIEKFKDKNS